MILVATTAIVYCVKLICKMTSVNDSTPCIFEGRIDHGQTLYIMEVKCTNIHLTEGKCTNNESMFHLRQVLLFYLSGSKHIFIREVFCIVYLGHGGTPLEGFALVS